MDIKKYATQRIPTGFDLSGENLAELAKADPVIGITAAYRYGFQRGRDIKPLHAITEDESPTAYTEKAEAALQGTLNNTTLYRVYYNATESGAAITLQAITMEGDTVDVYLYDEEGRHSIEIYGPGYMDKVEQSKPENPGQIRDNMEPYTMEDWKESGTFSAVPGQEVTEDVYNEMLNIMPPKKIDKPDAERWNASAGFCMGESSAIGPNGRPLFLAFIRKGGKAYFIGLAHAINDEE